MHERETLAQAFTNWGALLRNVIVGLISAATVIIVWTWGVSRYTANVDQGIKDAKVQVQQLANDTQRQMDTLNKTVNDKLDTLNGTVQQLATTTQGSLNQINQVAGQAQLATQANLFQDKSIEEIKNLIRDMSRSLERLRESEMQKKSQ